MYEYILSWGYLGRNETPLNEFVRCVSVAFSSSFFFYQNITRFYPLLFHVFLKPKITVQKGDFFKDSVQY